MNLYSHSPKISMLLLTLIAGVMMAGVVYGQNASLHDSICIDVGENTYWWAGVINHGNKMPLSAPYHANFNSNYGNQVQPLMLSSTGEVIWSDHPYQIDFSPGKLKITGTVQYYKGSGTLRDAYRYASRTYFPPSGKMPDSLLFTHPQYNTWIELMYDQNQKDVLAYAENIIAHGFPPGVLMIDDNWQEDYGKWNFHPGRFPNPGEMIDQLHDMGFKVMVWVCPFISPDCDVYRELRRRKYLVTDDNDQPAIVRWWNGASALLDLTNPGAFAWFTSQLDRLRDDYGVDGFKLDAGDFEYYEGVHSFTQGATAEEHSELFG
ncbi:MAG: alpha-galactosidase, partial [Deltaproteobacteria bacterium]|nr:alpha-galactosidase [Deltaproteobacteria bacterium]